MPNWKKVIVSGSDAILSNITASNISASGHISASNFIGDGSALTGLINTTGTPADNQIAIFTDSDTIEGTSSFTYKSSTRELLLGSTSAPNSEGNTLRIQGYNGSNPALIKLGWNGWGGTAIEGGFNGTTELYSYGSNAAAGGRLILGEGGDTGTNQQNYLWIRGDNADDSVHIYMGANSLTYSSEIGIERQEGTGINYQSDISLRAAAGTNGHKSEYIFSRKGMFQAQDAGFTVSGSGQVFINTTASLINPTTDISGFDQALIVNGDITASGLFASSLKITGSAGISGSLETVGVAASHLDGQFDLTSSIKVTVDDKTTNHRYPSGGGSSTQGYYFNSIESPYINFYPGKVYKFDQSDNTNSTHRMLFYLDAAKNTEYTTNVVTSSIAAGTAGAYTQITVTEDTPSILYYQCINHGYMGNAAHIESSAVSASYALTASHALNGGGNAFPFTGDAKITGSLTISGSGNSSIFIVDGRSFFKDQVTFGNSTADSVSFTSRVSSNFLSTGLNSERLGTQSEPWFGATITNITSSNISSSGDLFFSASNNSNTGFKTLVIDTSTGQVYHTGSYQGGGGSSTSLTVTEQDGSPSVSNVNTIKFNNGTVTDNGGGVVTVNNSGGTGGTFPFTGDAVITGSLTISESGANTYDTLKVNNAFYGTEVNSSTIALQETYYFRIPTGSYNGAFFDYVATSGSGDFFTGRSGTVQSIWEINSETPRVTYNDFSTRGIGGNTTKDLKFKVDIKNGNARLVSKDTTGQYQIKVIARGI
jgi:hypothetical protein